MQAQKVAKDGHSKRNWNWFSHFNQIGSDVGCLCSTYVAFIVKFITLDFNKMCKIIKAKLFKFQHLVREKWKMIWFNRKWLNFQSSCVICIESTLAPKAVLSISLAIFIEPV